MSFKEQWNIEKEKLGKMKAKDKFEYIWEYYKYWIIGIIACVFLIYGIVDAQIENSKDTYLYVTMVNSSLASSGEITLLDDFAAAKGINTSKVRVNLDTSIQMTEDMSDEYSINCSAKMFAQFAAKTIDVTIMNKSMIDFFDDKDAFYPLNEVLPANFYNTHKDQFITGTDSDGNTYICAMDISDSKLFQKFNAYSETPYFSIISNTENPEHCIEFLTYLYSENE
ncbi:hypothetical protein C8E03_1069 [Lachnotalea glycerini]|uniref:Extracellular solute-binding protein n=1 Tax=Lachnotalea glycerini TaxID=1763509 RepID=A0A255IMJ8_9FIRM|nr:hypothetical protein [Lachnotalea glycerini]PXV89362.1 hypothetical protein C8E03_1069 [Lachnotalea glycerini]RDY30748.1 hypothetical protein CG710_013130 [Lachnotalea glycerini]